MNFDIYTEEMSKSVWDKAFFMDKIIGAKLVIDFGCADGAMIRMLAPLFPNTTFYGYDINFIPDFVSFIDHTDITSSEILIFMSVVFTEDFSGYADAMSVDVYLNDELVDYGEAFIEEDGENIWCEFSNGADYLETGTYTVVLRYGDYEIASETTIVDNSWKDATSGGNGTGSGITTTIEGDTYIATIDCVNSFNQSMADEMG